MKVTLIDHTQDPLRAIGIAIAVMKEKDPIQSIDDLARGELEGYVDEIFKSKLQGALEFADFSFMVEGVTRAFTHQLVRHRHFSFSQQSMRFFDASSSGFKMPNAALAIQGHADKIADACEKIWTTYRELVEEGLPVEDARSILPTNVKTTIMFRATYRGLYDLAQTRLCLQTQEEFRHVMLQIGAAVESVDPYLASKLRPACLINGKCEFKSVFDRPCPIDPDRRKGGEDNGSSQES